SFLRFTGIPPNFVVLEVTPIAVFRFQHEFHDGRGFRTLRRPLLCQPATLAKSGARFSAKAVKASRASAVCSRSAKRSLSAPICASRTPALRISFLVVESEPAGSFARRAAM